MSRTVGRKYNGGTWFEWVHLVMRLLGYVALAWMAYVVVDAATIIRAGCGR